MGISNEFVEKHMDALFGEERAKQLRKKLIGITPEERELTIVEELCQAIKETGRNFVLPFRFRDARGTRTSHHLIFVSKGFKGYKEMKKIMAQESSTKNQGVASFEYSLATIRQPFLFQMSQPLDALEEILLTRFAARTVTLKQSYQEHNVGTPYIEKNYREALLNLEANGKITTNQPKRRKGTFGPNVTSNSRLGYK